MIDPKEDIDDRLVRLRQQTESIEPSPTFTERVMARLMLERVGWLQHVPTLWRRALPVAALLAMISAAWAYRNARAADLQMVIASDSDEAAEMDY